MLRQRKNPEKLKEEHNAQPLQPGNDDPQGKERERKKTKRNKERPRWNCMDSCCWVIGNVMVLWGILLLLYHAVPQTSFESLKDAISEVLGHETIDPPGIKLKQEGLTLKHPVVFVPGIVTGGLELWEGLPCADGLFRKRFWGGAFGEVYKRLSCWMDHMVLDNETGLDPPGIRLRAVSGLVAADYFMPGYFVWAIIIEQLAKLGYDENSMYMASYDWRLSFMNTEERDHTLSRLKVAIEVMVSACKEKAVVVPHSMGSIYFLFFLKWVEAPAPMGGGGGPHWVAKHIKAVMNIAGPLLGVPKAFTGLFSAEAKDIAVAREMLPSVMDTTQALQHVMRVSRTWDATASMLPKGGEVIWGDLDWSPEQGYDCSPQPVNDSAREDGGPPPLLHAHYGRMVAFGRDASLLPVKNLPNPAAYGDMKLAEGETAARDSNISCGETWTEYHEMSWRAVQEVARQGVYTAGDGRSGILGLLRKVAPRLMARADANWGFGIADNLGDKKYSHHKHWSNPLETRLPRAPEMEVYCLHGVGILTERAYVYKLSPYNDTCLIPFRIDGSFDKSSVKEGNLGCLKSGTYFVDGDETVPALSSGFMCAKGWRGKTRFNPSGSPTFVREYNHAPPVSLLDGRGTQSASHVDIMGNFQLVEDILRVASGSSGEDLGGDVVYSKLFQWAERIKLKL